MIAEKVKVTKAKNQQLVQKYVVIVWITSIDNYLPADAQYLINNYMFWQAISQPFTNSKWPDLFQSIVKKLKHYKIKNKRRKQKHAHFRFYTVWIISA